MTLGEKIRAARLEQKLTQEQLGGRDFTKLLTQRRSSARLSGRTWGLFPRVLQVRVSLDSLTRSDDGPFDESVRDVETFYVR